jgi:hypothetical protein
MPISFSTYRTILIAQNITSFIFMPDCGKDWAKKKTIRIRKFCEFEYVALLSHYLCIDYVENNRKDSVD